MKINILFAKLLLGILMHLKMLLALVTVFTILTGCGGSSSTTNTQTPTQETVKVSAVSQLKLTDVNGVPLSGATLTISPTSTPSAALAPTLAPTFTVGEDGFVSIEGLGNGLYTVTITIGGITFSTTIEIGNDNYQEEASVTTPVSLNEDGNVTLINNAIIASISGTVVDTSNVAIANAQVSISGGAATNGAFATALTDENGAYTLLVNVSDNLADALHDATLSASATGYATSIKTSYEVLTNTNKSGVNFSLSSASNQTILYSEDFESDTSSWTVHKLSGTNENNTWHLHTNTITGINKAYTDGLVKLAPNDTSLGAIPAPIGTQCFWYGNNVNDDATFGSFIGTLSDTQEGGFAAPSLDPGIENQLSGGTGTTDNSAELISPSIDLQNVSGDIKLNFDTFWEIESVNPNLSGYDIMTISVSYDEGATWRDLAKLNPLSDPQTEINRAPIPFSNTGYNSAPTWLKQESIPLVDSNKTSLSGKTIQLKFTFETNDGLYNGFRGWMIDNITITQGEGTYPLIEDLDAFYASEGSSAEMESAPAKNSAFNLSLTQGRRD